MEYKKIEEINKKLATVDIKGKDYIQVNERIKAFWQLWENGKIETEILSVENGICIIQARVYENKEDEKPRATGIAYEKENSTFINKTSYIENCETSAVGRALGNAGIGIDTSVASFEEVANAVQQQEAEKPITKIQADALLELCKNKAVEKDYIMAELSQKGYSKFAEIKQKEYMEFVKKFETFRRD